MRVPHLAQKLANTAEAIIALVKVGALVNLILCISRT
jgi:hypothetical protein